MDLQYVEVWRYWYDMQIKEQLSHQSRFNEDKPTVVEASPFNPDEDAEALRAAMKGFGTDEQAITDILTKRNADQRLIIQDKYQQIHGRDLIKDLKSELKGVFEKVILALMRPLPLLLAEAVKDATKGAGTDEEALIEIFCSRDDESIQAIKETFKETYELSVEEVVCKETSGEFEKTLMSILSVCREDQSAPSDVADELIAEDVDEDKIRRIFTSHTFPFLKQVFAEYEEKTEEDITAIIEKKCKKDCENAFLAICHCCKNRPEFYARALNKAMKGFGTDDSALIRIIVSRCEIDLKSIMEKYEELFEGKTLQEDIKKETSGDYEKALISLLGC